MQHLKITRSFFLAILFTLYFQNSNSQNRVIVKYYDSLWAGASKESAFFFTQFVKQDSFYNVTSYWMASGKLFAKSVYSDTLFSNPSGLLTRYYETGQIQDSSFYYDDGVLKNTYHYYPDGKLWAHYSYDSNTKKQVDEGFDETGKPIPGFIYLKEAEFPGGKDGWMAYLGENIKNKVPIKKGAPKGTYQVIISFVVNKDGKVSGIEPETSLGYGMEDEVIRVIKKSPQWSPLILLGKQENAFRRQPITFVVEEK